MNLQMNFVFLVLWWTFRGKRILYISAYQFSLYNETFECVESSQKCRRSNSNQPYEPILLGGTIAYAYFVLVVQARLVPVNTFKNHVRARPCPRDTCKLLAELALKYTNVGFLRSK